MRLVPAIERQRQELDRRSGMERRQRLMAVGAQLLHERRFREEDRRSDEDRRADNAAVANWMGRWDELRRFA